MEGEKEIPLHQDHSNLYTEKGKINELVVVVPATQTPLSSAQRFKDFCKKLSENELKDKISRTKVILVSLAHSIPDKGAKLKENLKSLEAEQERRDKERSAGTMILENKKKHKILDTSSVDVGEDKISNLPDELIHYILSFVPTKCVISTCILSKTWKYLSNCITTFDFREWRATNVAAENKHLEAQQFMDFLYMYLHKKPKIQKFYLTLDPFLEESRVDKLIVMVLKRNIEEFFLLGSLEISFIFPLSLFTCDSLTVLELEHVTVNDPSTVFLPRLKLLRLTVVEFDNGILVEKLISNCPILEECVIKGVCFNCEVLCIANVTLKNLCIEIHDMANSTVKICAPNLSTFRFGLEVPADFVCNSFLSLVQADVELYSGYMHETSVLIKLFEKLSNVKLLKLSGESFKVLSEADILLTDMPGFNYLKHLEFSSKFDCTTCGSDESVSTLRILLRFLKLAPYLESIVFAKGIHLADKKDVYYTYEEDDVYCWDEEDDIYCTDEEDDVYCTDEEDDVYPNGEEEEVYHNGEEDDIYCADQEDDVYHNGEEDDVYCVDQEDDDFWSVNSGGSLLHLKAITFKDFDGKPIELNAIELCLKYAGFLETLTVEASPELSRNNEALMKVMSQMLKLPNPRNCMVTLLPNSKNI